MELPLVAGIIGLGYYYKTYKQTKDIERSGVESEPKNIYESRRSLKILQDEFARSAEVYKEPNRIYPGPPKIDEHTRFQKIDYQNERLPIEFNSFDVDDIYTDVSVKTEQSTPTNLYNTNSPVSQGWDGISLSGQPINPKDFKHNNMVPFFRARVTQNVDDKSTQTILENFTGNLNYSQPKTELGPMFKAENNITNPYGMATWTNYEQTRYAPPKVMNNIGPVEPVRVGPGLNEGYTSEPSGGFQQANTRDYALPKTVDELRVKTNPKLTFKGRIISGSHISRPGKIGIMQKKTPDGFYENSPERYFTTVGAITGPKQRPNIIVKDVNRQTTGDKQHIGPAGPANSGSKTTNRISRFKTSNKITYNGEIRNADATAIGSGDKIDPKKTITVKDTTRQDTGGQVREGHIGPIDGRENSRVDNGEPARATLKEGYIDNPRQSGNYNGETHRGIVYDPEDKPAPTIKDQTLSEGQLGVVYKQDTLNSYVNDPNDKLKQTIKEQTLSEGQLGGVYKQDLLNSYVNDPNDKLKQTIKETTQVNDALGAAHHNTGAAYAITKTVAPNTTRQFTSKSYSGTAGAHTPQPQSYESIYNSIVRSYRELVAQGREPTKEGAKKANTDVNMTTRRSGDITSKYISERGSAPNKVYNSLPVQRQSSITKDSNRVPNEPLQDRLDSSLLDAYRNNPYTVPMRSGIFSK